MGVPLCWPERKRSRSKGWKGEGNPLHSVVERHGAFRPDMASFKNGSYLPGLVFADVKHEQPTRKECS